MKTLQDAFDTMVAHLRKQGGRALNQHGSCVYLTDEGKRCAVGAQLYVRRNRSK